MWRYSLYCTSFVWVLFFSPPPSQYIFVFIGLCSQTSDRQGTSQLLWHRIGHSINNKNDSITSSNSTYKGTGPYSSPQWIALFPHAGEGHLCHTHTYTHIKPSEVKCKPLKEELNIWFSKLPQVFWTNTDVWPANPQFRLPFPFAQFIATCVSVLADDAQARSSHPSLMGFTNAYWSAE